jgi:S1-C subfamily serine protease
LKRWEYDGNLGGCSAYIKRLNQFQAFPSNKPSKVTGLKNGNAWLGVGLQALTDDLARSFNYIYRNGVLVAEVIDNSPAMIAGLLPGDIIMDFDGKTISNVSDIPNIVAESPVNKKVTVKLFRNGKEMLKEVVLSAYDK